MMDFENLRDLLPAYALGALDENETAEVEAALARYPELRAELATYANVVGDLALTVPQVTPPLALKQKIMAAAQADPASQVVRPNWPRYVLAAAAVLFLIFMSAILWRAAQTEPEQPDQVAAILEHPDAQWIRFTGAEDFTELTGALVIAPDKSNAVLTLDNLRAMPDQNYQLWIVRGEERISKAVFQSQGEKTLLLIDLPADLDTYEAFGVTVEPPGGSSVPTGQRVFGQVLP